MFHDNVQNLSKIYRKGHSRSLSTTSYISPKMTSKYGVGGPHHEILLKNDMEEDKTKKQMMAQCIVSYIINFDLLQFNILTYIGCQLTMHYLHTHITQRICL